MPKRSRFNGCQSFGVHYPGAVLKKSDAKQVWLENLFLEAEVPMQIFVSAWFLRCKNFNLFPLWLSVFMFSDISSARVLRYLILLPNKIHFSKIGKFDVEIEIMKQNWILLLFNSYITSTEKISIYLAFELYSLCIMVNFKCAWNLVFSREIELRVPCRRYFHPYC